MRLVFPNPSLPRAARKLAVASLIIALGFALGGCSSVREARNQNPAWASAEPPVPAPQRQATYSPEPGDPIKEPPIEPRHAPNAVPDDPSEPFSPNYGGPRTRPPVKVSEAAPTARHPEPEQYPVATRLPQPSRAHFRQITTTASAD